MSGDPTRFTAPIEFSNWELKHRHFDGLLDAYRTVSGRHFDWVAKVWDFPMRSLDAFKAAIEKSGIPAEVSARQVQVSLVTAEEIGIW